MAAELEGKNGKVKVMYVRDNQKKGNGGGKTSYRNEKNRGMRGVNRTDDRFHRSTPTKYSKDNNDAERDLGESENFSPWAGALARCSLPAGNEKISTVEAPNQHEIQAEHEVDPELLQRQRREETRVYGENACQSLFRHRSDSIVRAWFLQAVTPRFRDCLRGLAENRKAYHVVDEAELEKVSGTKHHGGVCFLIKKRRGITVEEWLKDTPEQDCVLALEQVGNPYNIGGIMRSCAHFGIRGVLVEESTLLESGAAVRTAEGGAEWIQAIEAENLEAALIQFRQSGYHIVTTSSHKGTSLVNTPLPGKMVLVLGHEGEGLSDAIWRLGDLHVVIEGTSHIESLNVSVATGVFLAEWWRQNHNSSLS